MIIHLRKVENLGLDSLITKISFKVLNNQVYFLPISLPTYLGEY